MLFHSHPAQVGNVLAKQPACLREFFTSAPQRASAWFGHFSMDGQKHFKHGAAALAKYALAHRSDFWHLLKWRGQHPQAPVSVAAKPHYFCELDIPATVQSIAGSSDGDAFWESAEFQSSIAPGDILALDQQHWAATINFWLEERSRRSTEIYDLLCDHLEQGPWREFCVRLLPLLDEADVFTFASGILDGTSQEVIERNSTSPGALLALGFPQWKSLDDMLVASACGGSTHQLYRLLQGKDEGFNAWIKTAAELLEETPEAHWAARQQWTRYGASDRVCWLLLVHIAVTHTLLHILGVESGEEGRQLLQHYMEKSGVRCEAVGNPLTTTGKEKKRKQKDRDGKKRRKRRRDSPEFDWLEDSDEAVGGGGAAALGVVWRLGGDGDGVERAVTTVELIDEIVARVACAYVRWHSKVGSG